MKDDHAICIHTPNNTGHYDLCFCDLNSYKHKSFINDQLSLQQNLVDIHVLLPVFLDPMTNEYVQPKDFIQIKAPVNKNLYKIIEEQQQQRNKMKEKELEDAFAMLNAKRLTDKLPSLSQPISSIPNNNRESIYVILYTKTAVNMPANSKRLSNKTYSAEPNGTIANVQKLISEAPVIEAVTPEPQSSLPLSVYVYEISVLPENNEDNFPDLPQNPTPRSNNPVNGRQSKGIFRPTLGTDKIKTNRVLRIMPQKSSAPSSPRPLLSLLDR